LLPAAPKKYWRGTGQAFTAFAGDVKANLLRSALNRAIFIRSALASSACGIANRDSVCRFPVVQQRFLNFISGPLAQISSTILNWLPAVTYCISSWLEIYSSYIRT